MSETIKIYRVEDPVGQHGLWRDFDGSINPVFSKLTVGKCKDMPMDDSDFYRRNGKQWFAATDAPEKLKAWFDVIDIIEMEKLGYGVFEFEVTNIDVASPFEVVFTRDSIVNVQKVASGGIWENYSEKGVIAK